MFTHLKIINHNQHNSFSKSVSSPSPISQTSLSDISKIFYIKDCQFSRCNSDKPYSSYSLSWSHLPIDIILIDKNVEFLLVSISYLSLLVDFMATRYYFNFIFDKVFAVILLCWSKTGDAFPTIFIVKKHFSSIYINGYPGVLRKPEKVLLLLSKQWR